MYVTEASMAGRSRTPTKVAILSDSYLTKSRIASVIVNKKLSIRPHESVAGAENIIIENLSKGGQTVATLIQDKQLILKCVNTKPKITDSFRSCRYCKQKSKFCKK